MRRLSYISLFSQFFFPVVKLDLMGVDGELNGKQGGILFVWLMKDLNAGATAVEQAQKDVLKLGLGATSSAVVTAAGIVTKSVSTAEQFGESLSSLTDKLELIVSIGDKITTVTAISFLHYFTGLMKI
jgi:hypothetical protein